MMFAFRNLREINENNNLLQISEFALGQGVKPIQKRSKYFVAGSHSHYFYTSYCALYILIIKKHVGAASCRDIRAF